MATTPAGGVDAAQLRHAIYDKGAATRVDLAGLLALGREAGDEPAFLALLAEVAADVMTEEVDPVGYVSETDADWLVAQLGDGAGLSCRAEFEALKAVLGHAVSAPASLAAFGLREVERAILTGRRAAVGGAANEPGIVTAEDVEALRAVCYAPTAGAPLHVGRDAAEALFDIAHATATAQNDPAFPEFFARAVGNYLIGAAFVAAPSREATLAEERAMDQRVRFGAFLSRLAGGLTASHAADGRKSVEQLAEARYREENDETEARLDAASRIDAGEAKWVLAHLARGGELSPAEKRLIAFLRDEANGAPPEIAALFAQAA